MQWGEGAEVRAALTDDAATESSVSGYLQYCLDWIKAAATDDSEKVMTGLLQCGEDLSVCGKENHH